MKLIKKIEGAYPSSDANDNFMVYCRNIGNNKIKIDLFNKKILDTEFIHSPVCNFFNKPNIIINKHNEVFICWGDNPYSEFINIAKLIIENDLLVYIKKIKIKTELIMFSNPKIAFFKNRVYLAYQEHNDNKITPEDEIKNRVVLRSFKKDLTNNKLEKVLEDGRQDWRDVCITSNNTYCIVGYKASNESGQFYNVKTKERFCIAKELGINTVSYGNTFIKDDIFYHTFIGYPDVRVFLTIRNLLTGISTIQKVKKIYVNDDFDPVPNIKITKEDKIIIQVIDNHAKNNKIICNNTCYSENSFDIEHLNNDICLYKNKIYSFIQVDQYHLDFCLIDEIVTVDVEDNFIEDVVEETEDIEVVDNQEQFSLIDLWIKKIGIWIKKRLVK